MASQEMPETISPCGAFAVARVGFCAPAVPATASRHRTASVKDARLVRDVGMTMLRSEARAMYRAERLRSSSEWAFRVPPDGASGQRTPSGQQREIRDNAERSARAVRERVRGSQNRARLLVGDVDRPAV